MNRYRGENHTYVICAYNKSPFLEDCIKSLRQQSVLSQIIMVTSTPSDYITELADKYDILLYINKGEHGIAGDWNFALSKAKTEIVTIAHQDDIYEPWYSEVVLKGINESQKPLILFTDYGEIRGDMKEDVNVLLKIKRMMLLPLCYKRFQSNIFVRRRILSLGSPISCPTVSYFLPNLPEKLFTSGYKSDLDWQTWERLSRLTGEFIFCNKISMYHRIHADSTTTEIINENKRSQEDLEMFCKFWPRPIAILLEKIYKKGEKLNNVGTNYE